VKSQIWAGYHVKPHVMAVGKNARRYFSSPDYYAFLTNRPAIALYADLSHMAYGTVNLPGGGDLRLMALALLAAGLLMAAITREKFLCVCLVIIVSHFLTHVLTDGQESKRFVFDIEFLFYVLLVMTIAALNRRWARQTMERV
jgi:hypothetical protein